MPFEILRTLIGPKYFKLENYSPKVFLAFALIILLGALVSLAADVYQITHAQKVAATVTSIQPDPQSPNAVIVNFEVLPPPQYRIMGTKNFAASYARGLTVGGPINLIYNPNFPDGAFRLDHWFDAYLRTVCLAGAALLILLLASIVIVIRLCYGLPALGSPTTPEPGRV